MAPQPVRFGFAGMDHWYTAFAVLRWIQQNPNAVVTAAAHRNLEYLKEAAQQFGIPYTTTDYHAIVRREDVDVVVSTCTTAENPDLCVEAARHGKHIMSVKPMARTLAEADRIVAAVQEAKVSLFPFEAMTYLSDAFQQYQRWLDEGKIGRPFSALAIRRGGRAEYEWPNRRVARTWWVDPTKVPGGGWIDHSIYDVHALRKLLGSEVVRVSGEVANLVHKDIAPLEDYGVAVLVFANGVVATLEVTWSSGPQAGFHSFQLVGTEGQIVSDGISGRLAVRGNFAPFKGWVVSDQLGGLGDAVTLMVNHVRNGTPLPATVADGRQNLAVCLAFYAAVRDRKVVTL